MSGTDTGSEPPDASTVTEHSHMNIVRQYLQEIFPSLKGHSIRDKMKTKKLLPADSVSVGAGHHTVAVGGSISKLSHDCLGDTQADFEH